MLNSLFCVAIGIKFKINHVSYRSLGPERGSFFIAKIKMKQKESKKYLLYIQILWRNIFSYSDYADPLSNTFRFGSKKGGVFRKNFQILCMKNYLNPHRICGFLKMHIISFFIILSI